jgi:hypothetical protein
MQLFLDELEVEAAALYAQLCTMRGAPRARLLYEPSILTGLRDHVAVLEKYGQDTSVVRVVTRVIGGAVPASYGSPATTDEVRIDSSFNQSLAFLLTRKQHWRAGVTTMASTGRIKAQKIAYAGNGPIWKHQIMRAGQTVGVFVMPGSDP